MISKVFKNLRDYSNLKKNDALLVSYPKSGNTWIRFLICNYLENIQGNNSIVDFDFLNKNMPEFGFNLYQNQYFGKYKRVVKTHKTYLPIFRKNPTIYITRHPKSVLKSFYHYNNNLKQNPYFNQYTFSQFIESQYGIQGYLEHYKSWKDNYDLLIRYEDIQSKPNDVLCEIINFLEYPLLEESIHFAIEKSNVKTLKNRENGHKEALKKGYSFVGNNAAKSDLIYSQSDNLFLKQQLKKYNFTLYDWKID